MTIIESDYIYRNGEFQKDIAVAFDKKIQSIDSLDNLKGRYPNSKIYRKRNTVLYPGFINTHVHLEFSLNRTTLKYGSFIGWLNSVIENRERLVSKCGEDEMLKACKEMLESGITTFGAISSFGGELEICKTTPQKVIFFNELIGSQPSSIDMVYQNFLERLERSERCNNGITPAIAIHSPYSVRPTILKEVIRVAQDKNIPISSHLLESKAEREWLKNGSGEFLDFFKKFFSTTEPITTISDYLDSFDNVPTHFVHAVYCNDEELNRIKKMGHSIAHCPRSNRLLGGDRLKIEKLLELDIPFSVATDGLSSNYSLNIFDELRTSLMLHNGIPLNKLSKLLIKSITSVPSKIFGLNSGEIKVGKDADFALIELPTDDLITSEDVALHTILHTKKVESIFIDGEEVTFLL